MKYRTFSLVLLTTVLLLGGTWLAFGYFGVQALFTDTVVNEDIPIVSGTTLSVASSSAIFSTSTSPVATGIFEQGDSTYSIQGHASLIQSDGERVLALSDFSVTNGPDLYVYIVSASTTDNASVKTTVKNGAYVEIAKLKGNQGNQIYTLPKNLTIPHPFIISIWCKRFSRNFGSAKLESEHIK